MTPPQACDSCFSPTRVRVKVHVPDSAMTLGAGQAGPRLSWFCFGEMAMDERGRSTVLYCPSPRPWAALAIYSSSRAPRSHRPPKFTGSHGCRTHVDKHALFQGVHTPSLHTVS